MGRCDRILGSSKVDPPWLLRPCPLTSDLCLCMRVCPEVGQPDTYWMACLLLVLSNMMFGLSQVAVGSAGGRERRSGWGG